MKRPRYGFRARNLPLGAVVVHKGRKLWVDGKRVRWPWKRKYRRRA